MKRIIGALFVLLFCSTFVLGKTIEERVKALEHATNTIIQNEQAINEKLNKIANTLYRLEEQKGGVSTQDHLTKMPVQP